MRRLITACSAAALVALSAPATAQTPGDAIKVNPAVAGKGSHLVIDLRPNDDPMAGGRNPQGVVLAAAAGFKLDTRAVSERCSPERAKGFDCPGNSKIGTGTVDITASNGTISQDTVADVQFFLAPPVQSGDAAGVVVYVKERSTGQQATTTGRVAKTAGTFGLEVRFDELGALSSQAPQGFTLKVNRFQADVGTFRHEKVTVCCKTVKKNGKKKKVKYTKKVRRDLIVNPKTCTGSWPYQVRVRYSPSEESVRDGSVACSASRR